MEETVFDGRVYNYVVVYIDTIIAATNDFEVALKHKQDLLNNDFYLKKDKIKIYVKIEEY